MANECSGSIFVSPLDSPLDSPRHPPQPGAGKEEVLPIVGNFLESIVRLLPFRLPPYDLEKNKATREMMDMQNVRNKSYLEEDSPSLQSASSTSSVFRDNPFRIYPFKVDLSVDECSRNAQIAHVALTLGAETLLTDENEEVEMQNNGDESQFLVKPLTGGLSNVLYLVENPTKKDAIVLVRIHPAASLLDETQRERENRLLAWLSRRGEAPAFYGRFENGRVEQFYPSVRPLSHLEMPCRGPDIAVLMAKLHASTSEVRAYLEQEHPDDDDDDDRDASWECRADDAAEQTEGDIVHEEDNQKNSIHGDIWARVQGWLNAVSAESTRASIRTFLREDQIAEKLTWLSQQLCAPLPEEDYSVQQQAVAFSRDIVLAHMDAQSLNFLTPVDEKHGELKMIDFEYAGYNPRAYDIANTFSEYCDMNNVRADYEREYPTIETQDNFLRAYMREWQQTHPDVAFDSADEQAFFAALREEVGRYTLLSHLGWAIWSCVQHQNLADSPDMDFDYLEYAQHRMQGYRHFKRRFFDETENSDV